MKSLIAKKRNSKTLITHPSINQTTRIAALSEEKAVVSIDSASDIVRNFYSGINNHDLGSVEDLIAEKCVYEDLVFPQPFVGRKVNSISHIPITEIEDI
ncbi:Nuclear transport factor 2 (NTF2) family protein [Thalictrum thalictroides]|uniref:Nuclear transport factor 2 (NTF2) family protein n=1 Tax=Thalictrum thalictroides TaxID=46969 RepID=A0A7J6WFZ9_THATH|nr:Nuclear transport factor 2 (NTF2) family protein [Thalictrum thalictroides]